MLPAQLKPHEVQPQTDSKFLFFGSSQTLHSFLENMTASEGRPLVEAVEHEEEDFNDHREPSGCRCGCLRLFQLRWLLGHDEGKGLLEQKGESWLSCKLKKIKEVSEVIAGPKWKTFIRKMSGYGKKQQKNRFQYDERSYALNFNGGAQSEDEDMPPSFSARFSAPFPAGRSQPELGFVPVRF